jgi:hypothetical protein
LSISPITEKMTIKSAESMPVDERITLQFMFEVNTWGLRCVLQQHWRKGFEVSTFTHTPIRAGWWHELSFFSFVFCLFLSLSLSTHFGYRFVFHQCHQSKLWRMTRKRCCVQVIGPYKCLNTQQSE